MAKNVKPTLEDYIFDMESRPPDTPISSEQDYWSQLQKKESDLLLAAELGKALLEKNQELTKQNENLIDEYSAKLEHLEQEKHILRRKLSAAESEGDIRIQELETDYRDLKAKFKIQEDSIRQNEQDKNNLITELTSQNARLTSQIQLANEKEIHLSKQLEDTKNLYSLRNSNLQDHVNGLESLKDELRILSTNKDDLEKRLQSALFEKDTLCGTLDEALARIHTLERHVKEQESIFESTVTNLHRIQRENNTLSERLEPDNSQEHSSLHHEMDCDDDDLTLSKTYDDSHPIVKEAVTVYNQLKILYSSLKSNNDVDSGLHSDLFLDTNIMTSSQMSSTDSRVDKLQQGMLSSIADDLIHLVMGLDAVHFKTMLDQSRSTTIDLEEELRRRKDAIIDLECKISVAKIELDSAIEERDRARNDASENSLAKDEVVVQARNDRDAATARRTKAEIELAKTRVELMQASSELLEAIQQKVELAEQLEQWQMDMHELIEDQMRKQLQDSRLKPRQIIQTTVPKKTNRLLSLFQR